MAEEALGLDVVVSGFQSFINKMDKMDRAVDKTGKGWTGLSSIATGTVAVALGNIVVKAASAAANALVSVGKATVGLITDSTALAGEFQSMTTILGIAAKAAIDLGETSFKQLHDAALEVGGDTRLLGVSATGAADSMTGLYKAGLTTTEIFGDLQGYMAGTAELGGALRASIDLAAASELDMVEASDLAAVMLATFGGELETETERAEFINDALNNMVKAADASVAEVSDLAAALRNIGPVAAGFGFTLEDTNNALALLSTRGIAGSEAGTALRSMLTHMMGDTKKTREALDELNVSLYDEQGVMLSLPDIIAQFQEAMVGLTDEQKNQYIQTLAGTYGMRAMRTLLDEGVEGWDAMAEATANAAGIQAQAQARAATYAGQMEALKGTIETLKIGIGEAFLPVATDLAQWFAQMVDEHGPAIKETFEVVAAVIRDNLPAAIEFVTETVSKLVKLWQEYWPIISKNVQVFWTTAKPIFEAIVKWLREDGPEALTSLQKTWGEVWGFVQEIAQKFIVWFQENLPLIIETGQVMLAFWEDHIVPALDNVWEIIKTIIGSALDAILLSVTIAMQILTGDWEGAWENIKLQFAQLVLAMLNIWGEFLEGVLNAFGSSYEEFKAMWTANWELAKIIVIGIWDKIKLAFSQWMIDAVTAGQAIIEGFKQGVLSKVQGLIDTVVDAIRAAIAAAKRVLGAESPSLVFAQLGVDTMTGFAQGIQSMMPAVQMQIQAAIQPVDLSAAGGRRGGNTTQYYDQRQYHNHLTTQSVTRPGGLRLEFEAMSMASR